MINGKIVQFSLNTNDARLAKELHDLWLKEKFLKLREMKENKNPGKSKENDIESKDFVKNWEQYYSFKQSENLSKSQMNVKSKVFKDLKESFGRMKDFNQDRINILLSGYQGKYRNDSIRKYINEIKCFLNYCIKNSTYSRQDYDRLSWPKLTVKIRTTVITDSDLDKIFSFALQEDKDFYVYLTTLYYLSCRPGEIAGIRKEDFDLKNKTCRVWMNKTKKYKTVIITNDQYLEFMKNYMEKIPETGFICGSRDLNGYSKKFGKLKECLNLNPLYTLYTLRHTAGTNIYKNTKDVKFTANQLGDTEDLAIKHYVNLSLANYQHYNNSL